jgi:phosphopantetheinyl transferase
VRLVGNEFGKPTLIDPPGVDVNLRQSKGSVFVAIDEDNEVGIDIEAMTRWVSV